MSATAPQTSPAVVRSHSSSRRPQSANNSQDRPHRSQSTTARPSNHSQQPHPRPAPQQPNLANVARRDFEQSNLANSSPRRSESKDRAAPPPSRPDSSRRGHNRYASDASTASAMPTNGVTTDNARTGPQPGQPKRRTTINAPHTGLWALGKTIGAGSMGKVKLAKHAESGEQVRWLHIEK
jgi:hypothetical protein